MNEPKFSIKEQNMTPEYGEFIIEPLEPGYGHTVGNALRRALLTSIPGAAITSVKITGVKHRFGSLPGVKENVVDLLLNLKQLSLRLHDTKSATVKLSIKGPKEITAADLELPENVEVVDPAYYICSLADSKTKIEMELTVEKGFGYATVDDRKVTTIGVIPTDAIFTPVRRVNYEVSATRVGRQTNLDKLVMQVWTNGTVTPREAVEEAAKILTAHFLQIYQPQAAMPSAEGLSVSSSIPEETLKLTIDELDLPTRIHNSLRNGGIETLGQLLATPRKDLMSMRNMGGKSMSIIDDKLKEKGISLNA